MTILLHVVIAAISIILASYAYIRPSYSRLHGSYVFITLTLLSGFYLVWTMPGQMLRACMSGVAYLAVVTALTLLARQKLIRQKAVTNENFYDARSNIRA